LRDARGILKKKIGKFDSLIVGEFDSLTVGTRVALPPGVAGARGGKVSNFASSRFPKKFAIPPRRQERANARKGAEAPFADIYKKVSPCLATDCT
jgi:hypothetical protein